MMRLARLLAISCLALTALGAFSAVASAAVGDPQTSGPNYDRNPSVVQDRWGVTYMFFARTEDPCNRLAGCNPDDGKYDLWYRRSFDGGDHYGPATLAAHNPDVSPAPGPLSFRGRTIAATSNAGNITVFWADGGSEKPLYKVEKPAFGTFGAATPVAGVEPSIFNVEAVTRGSQTFLYTEGTGPNGYGVYARTYTGGIAGTPQLVAANRNIPKAIVDSRRGTIRLTYVDATNYPQVDVYVNSSDDGLTFGNEQLAVDAAPNESNWDPNLVQARNGSYLLSFAPDRQAGAGRQQVAAAVSPDFRHWSAPHDITPGEKDGTEYWDYWPEGFAPDRGNDLALFYTSERGFDGNATGIGHIWMLRGDDNGHGHGHD